MTTVVGIDLRVDARFVDIDLRVDARFVDIDLCVDAWPSGHNQHYRRVHHQWSITDRRITTEGDAYGFVLAVLPSPEP